MWVHSHTGFKCLLDKYTEGKDWKFWDFRKTKTETRKILQNKQELQRVRRSFKENGSCNIDIHSHVGYGVSYKHWLVSHAHLGCQQQIRFSESSLYLQSEFFLELKTLCKKMRDANILPSSAQSICTCKSIVKLCFAVALWRADFQEQFWQWYLQNVSSWKKWQTPGQAKALLTFKVKEKVWPLIKLCASEHF